MVTIAPVPESIWAALTAPPPAPLHPRPVSPPQVLNSAENGHVLRYARAVVEGVLDDLRAAPTSPGVAPRWEPLTFKAACRLVEVANTNAGYTLAELRAAFMLEAPRDARFTERHLEHKWRDAVQRVGARPLAIQDHETR